MTHTRPLTSEKMAPHRHPDYLPSCPSTANPSTSLSGSSLSGPSSLPSNSPRITSEAREVSAKLSVVMAQGLYCYVPVQFIMAPILTLSRATALFGTTRDLIEWAQAIFGTIGIWPTLLSHSSRSLLLSLKPIYNRHRLVLFYLCTKL